MAAEAVARQYLAREAEEEGGVDTAGIAVGGVGSPGPVAEGVEAGVLKLIGNEPGGVRTALAEVLERPDVLDGMRDAPSPYGDGRAGVRVAQAAAWRLGLAERPEDWVP